MIAPRTPGDERTPVARDQEIRTHNLDFLTAIINIAPDDVAAYLDQIRARLETQEPR